jgi:hypothetical protein
MVVVNPARYSAITMTGWDFKSARKFATAPIHVTFSNQRLPCALIQR